MSSPLYNARFTSKKGATVKVELSIIHPDVSDFGTDRLWGWKLLHEYVSPPDEGDDIALASRYVKSVKLSPLKNGKVAKKGADFFTVKRAGKKDPTVVYTIEVTDASLLADIKVGDGDEVYDYVEPGKGKKLTAPPKAGKASAAAKTGAKAGKEPVALEPKTYDDLRRLALEGIKKSGSWSDYILEHGMVQRWAKGASDDEVKKWLSYLTPNGMTAGAALVGLDRLAAKKTESAKNLLTLAESKYKAKDDNNWEGVSALAPLWWRLGETKKADAAFEKTVALMKKNKSGEPLENQENHALLSMLARGGRWDEVMKLVPDCLKDTYCDEAAAPAAIAAWEENPKAFAAIMKKWTEAVGDSTSDKSFEMSQHLLRRFLDRGEPEGYLELMLRYPRVIEDFQLAFYALMRTEQKDPKLAVAIGQKLMENEEIHSDLHVQTFGIFFRHDPKLLEPKLEKDKKTWMTKGYGMAFLAAAGLTKDLRSVIKKAQYPGWNDVARATAERELALEALHAEAGKSSGRDLSANLLIPMADLGEREKVDALLEKQLVKVGKLTTKDRDLPCRYFASAAAQLGRPELGFAAIKLPGPAMRRYSAGDMASGASQVGDFTTAWHALQLVPDDDSNGRVSSAIQSGLRQADEAFFNGPRAIPLAVNDEIYVNGLIAANDRPAIEWMLSAYGPKLPQAAQVAIDAFLEK